MSLNLITCDVASRLIDGVLSGPSISMSALKPPARSGVRFCSSGKSVLIASCHCSPTVPLARIWFLLLSRLTDSTVHTSSSPLANFASSSNGKSRTVPLTLACSTSTVHLPSSAVPFAISLPSSRPLTSGVCKAGLMSAISISVFQAMVSIQLSAALADIVPPSVAMLMVGKVNRSVLARPAS